jgi:hypothetical protein
MLILPQSCFLHVPKTGGSWVKKAIIASGISCTELILDGNPHPGLMDCPDPNKFKFAFVRHPVNLYRSYWQFKMTNGWDPANRLDVECRSTSFHQFVRNVLDQFPGIYGENLVKFVGPPEDEIEFVGKYENLVEDLILALKYAGERFDEKAIRTLSPCNVSDKIRFPAEYTDLLEYEVRQAEIMVIRRFRYD